MAGGQIDSAELVRRISVGDKSAEESLVDHFARPVHFILRNKLRDPELIRDAAQETFISLIENLRAGKLKEPKALAGYIQSTARNIAFGQIRRDTRYVPSDPIDFEIRSSGFDLMSEFERHEIAQMVREIIEELRIPRDREILLRFYYQEVDKPTLCEELGVTHTYFDNVISRARERLKELVHQRLEMIEPSEASCSSSDLKPEF